MANIDSYCKKWVLKFIKPAKTSRGTLTEKPSYFWFIHDKKTKKTGIGECSIIPGLSIDDRKDYAGKLTGFCAVVNMGEDPYSIYELLDEFPSIRFGLEMALEDMENGGKRLFYRSAFSDGLKGIPINGLIWMDNEAGIIKQTDEKIADGFTCLKMKIGAIGFEKELNVIRHIRAKYGNKNIEIRLDANGAFSPAEAPLILKRLEVLDIHSIEQPIKKGQWKEMARLCKESPIKIALDEELIGIRDRTEKAKLLDQIMPQYIILKPSLIGGFSSSEEWIRLAEERHIGWWVTSALESNIGLNAIAQWVSTLNTHNMPQGLGTGSLYKNNIPSPLTVSNGYLFYNRELNWELKELLI